MPAPEEPGLRWGLVGASDIAAQSIIPAVRAQPGGAVVAVHSRSPERGAAYARQHGIPRSHGSLEALLADDEVDAVYVSTTNDRHHDEVVAAAAAGRHVLCEKPLALTLADAADAVARCAGAGVVLATNHGRRGDPALRAAREAVRSGRLGVPLAARTCTAVVLPERLRGWRLRDPAAGGGAALDVLVHDADTLRFVLDDEPVAVQAAVAARGLAAEGGEPAVEDTVAGVLEMASGLLASFLVSFTTPHGTSGVEVHGEHASLLTRRGPEGPSLVLRSPAGEEAVALPPAPPVGVSTVAAFEAAVRGRGRPSATGEDGLASLAVALGALESAAQGRRTPIAVG